MLENRFLVAGLDKAANNELAKNLMLRYRGLVQSEHEFQRAIECGGDVGKYGWLNLFIDQENHYHQTLLILWMSDGSLEKRGRVVTTDEKKRLLDYANEVSFQPYSKKGLNTINTRIYFINVGAKVRYQELAETIINSLEGDSVPGFSVENTSNFAWTMPYDVLELYPRMD